MSNRVAAVGGWGRVPRVGWAPLLVGAVIFLNTSDFSALALALPDISATFGTDTNTALWVVLAVPLVATASAPLLGGLGDRWGRKPLFVGGTVLFAVATGWGALAGSIEQLILTRVLFGLSATALVASGTALLALSVAEKDRARALSVLAVSLGVGLAAGPVIGGGLVESLGWRALLALRIPLIVILIVAAWLKMPEGPRTDGARGIDRLGAVTLFGVLFAFSLAVNRGGAWGWGSAEIVGLFAGSAVALPVLLMVERRSASPVLPPSLFQLPGFGAAALLMVVQFAVFASLILVVPLYLVQGRGYGALEAGAITAAFPLALAVTAPLAGRLSGGARHQRVAAAGLAVLTLGMALLALVDSSAGLADVVWRLVVVGIGAGLFQAPNLGTLMGKVPAAQTGIAAGTTIMIRNVGISLGLALGGAIYVGTRAASDHGAIADDFEAAMIAFAAVAGGGLLVALLGLRPAGGTDEAVGIAVAEEA